MHGGSCCVCAVLHSQHPPRPVINPPFPAGNLKLNGNPSGPIDLAQDPLGRNPLPGNPYALSPLNGVNQSIWTPRTSLEHLAPTPLSPPKPFPPAPGPPLIRYPPPDSPASVYVSNVPQEADNLWIYKRQALLPSIGRRYSAHSSQWYPLVALPDSH